MTTPAASDPQAVATEPDDLVAREQRGPPAGVDELRERGLLDREERADLVAARAEDAQRRGDEQHRERRRCRRTRSPRRPSAATRGTASAGGRTGRRAWSAGARSRRRRAASGRAAAPPRRRRSRAPRGTGRGRRRGTRSRTSAGCGSRTAARRRGSGLSPSTRPIVPDGEAPPLRGIAPAPDSRRRRPQPARRRRSWTESWISAVVRVGTAGQDRPARAGAASRPSRPRARRPARHRRSGRPRRARVADDHVAVQVPRQAVREQRDEHLDEVRVELDARLAAELVERGLVRDRRPVRPPRDHRLVRVDDGHDPGADRDVARR